VTGASTGSARRRSAISVAACSRLRPSPPPAPSEDADDLQLVLLTEGMSGWQAAPFLQLVGHDSSEIAGPAFNPAGDRLYFSSQRGTDGKTGLTYEITGPFLAE
jgi:hypothetical protein